MSRPILALQEVFCLHRTAAGDAAALQGLSLELREHERVCVIGSSGAGKTTLLRVAAGLEAPSAGEVAVFGHDPGRMSARGRGRLRNRYIGFLDQHAETSLSPDLPVGRSIALPLALRRVARRAREARVGELLAAVELADRAEALPAELSGGERQRLALCVALAPRPRLLLADEPTAELDAVSAAAVTAQIAALAAAEGTAVLAVSHDPALAALAERTVSIEDGRLVSEHGAGVPRLVVGRGGWIRLPESLREAAGVDGAVEARATGAAIVLRAVSGRRVDRAARAGGPSSTVMTEPGPPVEVELERVSVSRGSGAGTRLVLADLDASFRPGTLTAVAGRSGSGKTTLLELIAGLGVADRGEVRIAGAAMTGASAEARAEIRRRLIGYLGQEPAPLSLLSGAESVALALRVRGVARGRADAQARTWLTHMGLDERADARVRDLSAGEAQRVALAAALACARGLLLVDEPTSRLDRRSARSVAELLRAAADAGQTVICATHDPELAAAADHVLALGPSAPARSDGGWVGQR